MVCDCGTPWTFLLLFFFASLFGCTSAGQASDSMTAPAWILLNNWVGAWCSGSGRVHRSPDVGFLLLPHFSYFLLSTPYRCFISVLVWLFMFSEMLHCWVRNPSRGLSKCLAYTTAELRASVVATYNLFKPTSNILLTFPRQCFCCGLLFLSVYVFACMSWWFFYFG